MPDRLVVPRPAWLTSKQTPVDELPPGSPTGRAAANILAAEQLSELRALHKTTTEAMARLAGLIVNNVLDVNSLLFPASGYQTQEYHVAAGCVSVDNQGQNTVWVTSGGYNGSASGRNGPGQTPVPPGAQRLVNLASRTWTIVGTPGDLVAWQAFTAAAIPGSTIGSVNGGTP